MTNRPAGIRRSIAVTHEVEAGDALVAALEAGGLRPLFWPAVRTVAVDPDSIESVLSRADEFTWLVVTSRRAVDAVASGGRTLPDGLRIATVGHRTAAAVEAAGWKVDLTAAGPGSATLATELESKLSGGERILFPSGDLASMALQDRLARAGAVVDRVTVYRTERRPVDGAQCGSFLARGDVAAITFLSASAGRSLAASLDAVGMRAALRGTPAVAIGPETARALDDLDFEEVHQSAEPSKESVASCALDLLWTPRPANA
jgi:uroporphyrinogen-III synthase